MVWVGLYSQWGIKIGKTSLVIMVYILWTLKSTHIDGFFIAYVFSFFCQLHMVFSMFLLWLKYLLFKIGYIWITPRVSIDIFFYYNLYSWVFLFEY